MNTYQISLDKTDLPVSVDGRIGLKVAPDVFSLLRNEEPFTPDVARGPEKVIQAEIGVREEVPLTLRSVESFGLSVEAGAKAVLDLVWPEESSSPLAEYGISAEDDTVYLVLSLDGRADVTAEVAEALPRYPLSVSLGLETGGELAYTRAVPYPADRPSSEIVRTFVSGLRLPQDVRSVETLPAEGEVLDLRFGGYLTLGLEAGWGYDLQKFTRLETGTLDLESRLEVTARSSLNVTCGIAGEYSFVVRRDPKRASWARVQVRKTRRRTAESALDLRVGVTSSADGLPEEASSLVAGLLGTSVPDQVTEMRTLLGDPGALVERLESEVGALTERAVRSLFERWYPEKTIEEEAGPFLADLESALDRYEELAGEEGRWTGALAAYTVDELNGFLEELESLQKRSELASITEPLVLEMLRRLAGEEYGRMVASDTAFSERKQLIEEKLSSLLEEGSEQLLDLAGLSRDVLEVDALLEQLRGYDSPEELKEQAEAHLLELASRLSGRAFGELSGAAELEDAFQTLDRSLRQLEQLAASAYEKFESALNQSYTAKVGRTYARTRQNEALLDLRIDLSREKGRALIRDVLHGNLAGASRRAAAGHCEIVGGTFSELTRETSRLTVNLMDWRYEHVRELALRHERSIQQEGEGLLHVYQLSAEETEVRQRRRESMEFSFLAGLMAEGAVRPGERAPTVDVVRKLAIEYGFLVEDRSLTDAELETYLSLARYLGLLPPGATPDGYVEDLRGDLGLEPGEGWGTVTLDYRVSYDPDLLLELFETHRDRRDESLLRSVYRRVAAANFRGTARTLSGRTSAPIVHRRIADGLTRPSVHRAHLDGRLRAAVSEDAAPVLETLFNWEEELVDAFDLLHGVVTADTVPQDDLTAAFDALARLRDRLEQFLAVEEEDVLVNPFFAIIDQMQALKFSQEADRRTSYAELRIEKGEKELLRVMTG